MVKVALGTVPAAQPASKAVRGSGVPGPPHARRTASWLPLEDTLLAHRLVLRWKLHFRSIRASGLGLPQATGSAEQPQQGGELRGAPGRCGGLGGGLSPAGHGQGTQEPQVAGITPSEFSP